MKTIIREFYEHLPVSCSLFVCYSVLVCILPLIFIIWFGVESLVLIVGALLATEVVCFMGLVYSDNYKLAEHLMWLGLIFHVLGFVIVWLETTLLGWWGRPFEWQYEYNNGVIINEESPVILWSALIIEIIVRLIVLHPLYVMFIKHKRHFQRC
jgi:hypothetical protein